MHYGCTSRSCSCCLILQHFIRMKDIFYLDESFLELMPAGELSFYWNIWIYHPSWSSSLFLCFYILSSDRKMFWQQNVCFSWEMVKAPFSFFRLTNLILISPVFVIFTALRFILLHLKQLQTSWTRLSQKLTWYISFFKRLSKVTLH